MNLPPPTPPKATRKRLTQAKTTKFNRLAVVEMLRDVPVSVTDTVTWALRTADDKSVKAVVDAYPLAFTDSFIRSRTVRSKRARILAAEYEYNYVVPRALVMKLQSVVAEEIKNQERVDRLLKRRAARSGEGSDSRDVSRSEHDVSEEPDGATDDLFLSLSPDLPWFSR